MFLFRKKNIIYADISLFLYAFKIRDSKFSNNAYNINSKNTQRISCIEYCRDMSDVLNTSSIYSISKCY